MDKRRFEGKHVVVIGASGGLGESYVRAFLAEGAAVLLAGRNEERLQALARTLPGETVLIQVDITDADSVNALAAFAKNWAGELDVVVNATGYDARKSLEQHQLTEIHKSLDVNLLGAILISKAFLPLMREQSGGVIVHMGGFTDGRLAFPYYSVDVATRSGIFAFSEAMNRELNQEGKKPRLLYFCPNSADTEAERPYHPIWKEMGVTISSTEQVAKELLNAVAGKKAAYLMGGAPVRFFAKLNALSPKLADRLMMNKYGVILKKHLGAAEDTGPAEPPKKGGALRNIAIVMVVLSWVLYALLPAVPFLPVDLAAKAAITGGMLAVSEVIWWLGLIVLGKELSTKIRQKLNPCNWFRCKTPSGK